MKKSSAEVCVSKIGLGEGHLSKPASIDQVTGVKVSRMRPGIRPRAFLFLGGDHFLDPLSDVLGLRVDDAGFAAAEEPCGSRVALASQAGSTARRIFRKDSTINDNVSGAIRGLF